MNGEAKLISQSLTQLSDKRFNMKISDAKTYERSIKLLKQSRDVNILEMANKSLKSSFGEIDNNVSKIPLAELIQMSENNEIDQNSKIKNPFEWFEELLHRRISHEFPEDFNLIENEQSFLYYILKHAHLVSDKCLKMILRETVKLMDEFYNILGEQVNEYISIFIQIFELYLIVDNEDSKFNEIHETIIQLFAKSTKNRTDEMVFLFRKVFIEKIFVHINDVDNKEKLFYLCEILVRMLDPNENQQVEFFKLFKVFLKKYN